MPLDFTGGEIKGNVSPFGRSVKGTWVDESGGALLEVGCHMRVTEKQLVRLCGSEFLHMGWSVAVGHPDPSVAKRDDARIS